MKTYFDVIFVVLNVILFAISFHSALESQSSKSYLGMALTIAAITLIVTNK